MTVQELREIINVYGILSLSNTYKLYQNDCGHHSYGNLTECLHRYGYVIYKCPDVVLGINHLPARV